VKENNFNFKIETLFAWDIVQIIMSWFDYIKEHPDKKWNYYKISGNPNITWNDVEANPDKQCQ
jgi:hypothetical protein